MQSFMRSIPGKTLAMLALLAALGSGAAFAAGGHEHAHGHAHEHTPLHGGIVAEAGDIDFELTIGAALTELYVRDHGKPLDTAGASAKLTLLDGAGKTELVLTPAAGGKFEAPGRASPAPGTKAVALVTLPGRKPVNVRFAWK